MVHKGSEVSIGTQPEEESMQRPWIIEKLSNLELDCKGIMIYKAKDQKQTLWSRMDKFNRHRGTINDNLIGENQLTFQMTSKPEGWILGSDWELRAFATNWIYGLKMIMTRDANKITRLKINHNASKQEFQEQKGSWGFSEDRMVFRTLLWSTWINWEWADTR